jgi:hypothetical protein
MRENGPIKRKTNKKRRIGNYECDFVTISS